MQAGGGHHSVIRAPSLPPAPLFTCVVVQSLNREGSFSELLLQQNLRALSLLFSLDSVLRKEQPPQFL